MENMNLMDVLNILSGTLKKDVQGEKTKETPETETKTLGGDESLNEVVEMDFEKIQKGEMTYDEAITEFKKCNHFICKNLLGWLITPEEETMLNMKYAEELKKMVDKANEKSEPVKDLDYYVNKCASICLPFILQTGNGKMSAAAEVAYVTAFVDAGVLVKEDNKRFVDAVTERMMVISGLK